MTPHRSQIGAVAAVLVAVAFVPIWSGGELGSALMGFAVLALSVLGWTSAAGRIGVTFLGGHGFAAVGATLVYLVVRAGLPAPLAVAAAVVVGSAAGALLAVVTRGCSSLVAAATTMIFGAFLAGVSAEVVALVVGFRGPVDLVVRDVAVSGPAVATVVGLAAVAVLTTGLQVLSNSRTALVLQGGATRADYVGSLGIVMSRARAWGWAVVGASFGAAGALDAWGQATVVPVSPGDLFRWTAPAIAVAGIAGLGEPLAAVVVTALYTAVDHLVPGSGTAWPTAALVLSVVFMVRWPRGLSGLLGRWPVLRSRSVRRFSDANALFDKNLARSGGLSANDEGPAESAVGR